MAGSIWRTIYILITLMCSEMKWVRQLSTIKTKVSVEKGTRLLLEKGIAMLFSHNGEPPVASLQEEVSNQTQAVSLAACWDADACLCDHLEFGSL